MKVTFLGTGTSTGIPVIGCECAVCTAAKQPGNKNNRLRCSILIEINGQNLLVDCGQDFRQQMLNHEVKMVDAVFFTHAHADHCYGIPDLRTYNTLKNDIIPCYANQEASSELRRIYSWIFGDAEPTDGSYVPQLTLTETNDPFQFADTTIIPIPIMHGTLPILGVRVGNFAYLTDVTEIPEDSKKLLEGCDTIVLGALRPHKHPNHYTFDEAIACARELGIKQTYFVHMAHYVDHDEFELPEGIEFAYDGLILNF